MNTTNSNTNDGRGRPHPEEEEGCFASAAASSSSSVPLVESDTNTNNNTNMYLEEDEHDLALELKETVEQRDDLRPLSDFMYAAHAIACHGNMETAIDRITGLQCFCDEYGIVEDTTSMVSQGIHAIEQFLELHPTSILSVDHLHKFDGGDSEGGGSQEEEEEVVAVAWDLGQIYPEKNIFRSDKQSQSDRHWKIHVRGWYYVSHAWFPNFACVRNGNVALIEGSNFGWDNFSPKCEQRHQEEFFLHYPMNPRKVLFYDTNVVVNTFASMIKPILPKSMQDAFEVGCTIGGPDGDSSFTLRDLLLQPTAEVSQQTVLRNVQKLLEERNQNIQSFRLT